MYTIGQAAARSGISVPLLRAWERRYRIVVPQRTPAGYRLYDDTALDRLRSMRRLVDAGWTPSTAAAAILAGERLPEVDASAPRAAALSEPRDGGGPAGLDSDLVRAFVDAAAALDAARLEAVLDAMFALGTFETVAGGHLLPALAAVGDGWASGRLSVAAEHAASHAALRRLATAYQAAGRPSASRGAILVGMAPGVRHELGALAFSIAARRAGLPILYLGPDLPVADWVATALETDARAAVIGAVTESDAPPSATVAEALRSARPDLLVCFGGRAASGAGALTRGTTRRPLILPEPLEAAVSALSGALADRATAQPPDSDRAAP